MQILIAPNAFKNSLSAEEAAKAIEKGLSVSRLKFTSECFPVGDGGDGTGQLIADRLNGVNVCKVVNDPLSRPVNSCFFLVEKDQIAIIELANASGLRLLKYDERDPLHANTFGTGELILHALNEGVQKIILCIGGSATIDGGIGILRALGIQFLNKDGGLISDLPIKLNEVHSIDSSLLDNRVQKCKFMIVCDVDNPLLGINGAATVFGPQKGAKENDVRFLEGALKKFSELSLHRTGKEISSVKYGGAAGGTAAGLYAWLNADLVNGIDYFMDITSFNRSLQKADLLITGEGSIDDQTLHGKGPLGIAKKAKALNIPVIGLAGSIQANIDPSIYNYFDVLLPITNAPQDFNSALSNTYQNLLRTSTQIGNLLSLPNQML